MLLKSNIKDLKNILKADNVLSHEEECYCYAEDAGNFRASYKTPDVVVFVETTEDVQKVVRYAYQHNIPIVCRGAGTNTVGACICEEGGIVLNFSKMNKILEFSPDDMTMKVQAGAVLGEIKKVAESEGLYYPPDPSNFKVSTIGGSIAQSSGGAKSFKYGTTKDYILGLTVVLADGNIMKIGAGTIKDAAGYHLSQLIVGSEGTLAIVVEAELKLIPKPEASAVITAYFDDTQKAVSAVNSIIKSRVFPSTIDFMDKNSINTVEKFYPCGLDTEKECVLIIETEGFKISMEHQVQLISKALADAGASGIDCAYDEKQKESLWTARRSSYAATAKLAPDVITDDIIVPRSKLAGMVDGIQSICKEYGLQACIVGHIGDGNLHPQIALNMESDEEFKNCMEAKAKMYALVSSLGGALSAEHGIGIEKRAYVEKFLDKYSLEYMRRIKKLFDPTGILNPNKIFKI